MEVLDNDPWMDNGGPAFPAIRSGAEFRGMPLRDYFAAKALQGFLANPNQDYAPLTPTALANVVKGSYELADAMLAARETK